MLSIGAFICCVLAASGSEIIGGKEVTPHSLPFMALLENGKPLCGGVLIHPNWVLTAAHCENMQKVQLGVHSIKSDEKYSRQVRLVMKAFPHPCYDNETGENDLMLLKLNKPVKESQTVKPLQLKVVPDPAKGTSCLIAGWGDTKFKANKMSDVLMSANVTVIDRKKCNSKSHYNQNLLITKSMICAGFTGRKASDACQGDSGGPLLCKNALVGITSFGISCGEKKYPGVYSFLSEKQIAWIKKTMTMAELTQK